MSKGTLCQIQGQEKKEHGMIQEPQEAGIRSGERSGMVKDHLYQVKESGLYDSRRPLFFLFFVFPFERSHLLTDQITKITVVDILVHPSNKSRTPLKSFTQGSNIIRFDFRRITA